MILLHLGSDVFIIFLEMQLILLQLYLLDHGVTGTVYKAVYHPTPCKSNSKYEFSGNI